MIGEILRGTARAAGTIAKAVKGDGLVKCCHCRKKCENTVQWCNTGACPSCVATLNEISNIVQAQHG